MYQNKDGRGDTIFCFSEQRVYRPSDVVNKGLLSMKIDTIFTRVWNQLSEITQEGLIALYQKPVEYLPERWKANSDQLSKFKRNEIDYRTYIGMIASLVD